MSTIPRATAGALATLCLSLSLASLSALVLASGARAQSDEPDVPPVALTIQPADGSSFFRLRMKPGEVRELRLVMTNGGQQSVPALAYRADVYTIRNGGMGSRLARSPIHTPTTWVTFPRREFQIDPGQNLPARARVAVPPDATPGEYVTSLVLQNRDPVASDRGDLGAGIQVRQVLRSAVAIRIVVPGALEREFRLGDLRHTVSAQRSTVLVPITNLGNTILRPEVSLSLEGNGQRIEPPKLTMDSTFPGTVGIAEFSLGTLLDPGCYRADAEVTIRGQESQRHTQELCVAGDDSSGVREAPSVDRDRRPLWLIPVAALLVLLALTVGFLIRRRRRGRRSTRRRFAPADVTAALDLRLARGEITLPEYLEIRRALDGRGPMAPTDQPPGT